MIGESKVFDLVSLDEKEKFLLDVNRKGRIKLTKCTYQKRYRRVIVLARLDIDGPPHTNPDGEKVLCPHLHIYKEGYGEKWAYPVPLDKFSDTKNLDILLRDFMKYCNVVRLPIIQGGVFNGYQYK